MRKIGARQTCRVQVTQRLSVRWSGHRSTPARGCVRNLVGHLWRKAGEMIDFVIEREIAREPVDVFAYMVDATKLASWQRNTVSAVSDGPMGLGTKIREVHRAPGRRQPQRFRRWTGRSGSSRREGPSAGAPFWGPARASSWRPSSEAARQNACGTAHCSKTFRSSYALPPGLADDVDGVRKQAPLGRPLEQEARDGLMEHLIPRARRPRNVVVDAPQCHRVANGVGGRLFRPCAGRDH